MANKAELKGKKFGKLTVIRECESVKDKPLRWVCLCDCGATTTVITNKLVQGKIKSCGCWKSELCGNVHLTHGSARVGNQSLEYVSWRHMKERCLNPKNKRYADYGGRGIKICEQWLGKEGFANFLSDMGRKPSPEHTLDRFPNNDGNYEPSNCRWGTDEQQNRNRRSNIWIEYNGEKNILKDWAKILNINYKIKININKE